MPMSVVKMGCVDEHVSLSHDNPVFVRHFFVLVFKDLNYLQEIFYRVLYLKNCFNIVKVFIH